MLTFNHSGTIEELLYSLYFIKDCLNQANQNKCILNLKPNKDMVLSHIIYIKSLLQKFNFIKTITTDEIIPINALDVTTYKDINFLQIQNLSQHDMREYPYIIANTFCNQQFWKPIDKFKYKYKLNISDKILLCSTDIGISNFDYSILKLYKEKLIYMGIEDDHQALKLRYKLDIPRIEPTDALQTAKLLNSVKLVISNQNTSYAIAEILKFPRILIHKDFYNKNGKMILGDRLNILPLGGICATIFNEELLKQKIDYFLIKNRRFRLW